MLQCFKCGGTFSLHVKNKNFNLFGLETIQVKDLRVYVCDRCGQEILPDKSIEKINQMKNQFLAPASGPALIVPHAEGYNNL